jgi:hypothetical protein
MHRNTPENSISVAETVRTSDSTFLICSDKGANFLSRPAVKRQTRFEISAESQCTPVGDEVSE